MERESIGTAGEPRTRARVHITIYAADLKLSERFYEALLGVSPRRVRPGFVELDLQDPPLRLVLQECAHRGTGTVNHLGLQFAAPDRLEAAKERLSAQEFAFTDLPNTTCRLPDCPPRWGTVWANDPDGTRWELYVERSEEE